MVGKRQIAALCSFAGVVGSACADPLRPATVPPAPIISAGSLLQVGIALLLVLAAVAGVAWLLKRFTPNQAGFGGRMQVISATSVGQRERVVLVEIGETWLVLGVAPGRVNALHTLPRPASTSVGSQGTFAAQSGFSGWLKQTMERGRGG